MNSYTLGQSVRCSVAFANLAGTATDPTVVNFKVISSAGTTTTYVYGTDAELVKDSTGNYHLDVFANAVGVWNYKFEGDPTGSGNLVAAGENKFNVSESAFD